MKSMMEGMGGGEHRRPYKDPLYPRLLNSPPNHAAGRHALVAEAQHRMASAAAAIGAATQQVQSAQTSAERRQSVDRLREATAEFQAAATIADGLRSGTHGQAAALDWFRERMNLPKIDHTDGSGIFGLSAVHLLLMTLVGLLAASLLLLQVARLRRARQLLTAEPAVPTPANIRAGAPQPEAAPNHSASQTIVPSRRRWSGQLRVAHISDETPTIETYRLVPADGSEMPFDFLPGQFVQVEVEYEPGKKARRSYTIASSPTQRAFVEISVKREEHGAVSRFLNEHLSVGDLIKVTGPFGAFTFTGTDAESIVLIAGGVGITPMMSVLRYLTDKAWPGEIFLLYGARSTEEFVFREEIERLERRHANLHVLAAMPRAPGTVWLGPEGNLTRELITAAVPQIGSRRIHLCGPPAMMSAVRALLLEIGVPEAQIFSEAFGPASLPSQNAPSAVTGETEHGPVLPPAVSTDQPAAVAATTVTFAISGVSAPLETDQSVLEAAEKAGVEIPYQCRVGICGVCVTKLKSGEVTMAVESGLDAGDKAEGYVLACQAKTKGGPLVVEA
jgi:ferredoxin-NADP reductase